MKNCYPNGETAILLAVLLAGLFCGQSAVFAQAPVKGVYAPRYKATTGSTYSDGVSAGSGLSGTYTYTFGTQTVTSNNYQRLDTFTIANTYNGTPGAGTSVFIFNNTAVPVVKFRRANNAFVTGRRRAIWFESDGNTPSATVPVALRPEYNDSLESIFGKRLFNMGVDNAFENGTGTNNNNIERIDVIFPTGIKTFNPDSAGFTVFDRGAAGGNDSFMVAAIKSLDANGDPADYYPALRVGPANYGAAAGTTLNFHALRRDDAETNLKLFIVAGNQAREGVYFSFRSLGFPYSSATSGNLIYGYSVMATDVNLAAPGTPKNMVYYTNATIFPTNTELGSVGGIDMVAVSGVAATINTALLLPVLATHFNAIPEQGRVALSWQLANGDALREQIVERSGNGIAFSSLGNSIPLTDGMQYAVDEHPASGPNYYRLRMVDNGGDISYSPIATVSMDAPAAPPGLMEVYPVPVSGKQFTINAPGITAASCLLEMTDMNGRRVFQQRTTGSRLAHMQVNLLNQLPAGVYTIRLTGETGAGLLIKKILVSQ